ncbi:MAG TPA: fructose PTS transporter subunit IIA, partial [Bacteroidota bacterium]
LRECRSKDCRKLLDAVLQRESPQEVETMLKEFLARATDHSLVNRDLVRIDSVSRSKEEALRELVNILHLAGRVDDADRVEDAIWQREEAYSTGVGFGVAIPHCKSANVLANSIAVLKLRHGIEWNSLDNQPVELVILIVIKGDKAGEEHLKMIASLSRKLMDEEFRRTMMSANEETALLGFVKSALKQ